MEITVKVTQILPQQSGVSKSGNQWTIDTFIGETFDQYPKKIAFRIFNARIACPSIDSIVTVKFDLESRSYVGRDNVERWSTDVTAWAIDVNADSGAFTIPTPQPVPVPAASAADPAPGPVPVGTAFGSYTSDQTAAPAPDTDLPF